MIKQQLNRKVNTISSVLTRTLFSILLLLFFSVIGYSQVNFTGSTTIDFTGFTGAGFKPTPAVGQLDSDNWAITGMSDGDLVFGVPELLEITPEIILQVQVKELVAYIH